MMHMTCHLPEAVFEVIVKKAPDGGVVLEHESVLLLHAPELVPEEGRHPQYEQQNPYSTPHSHCVVST